jgi:hypothetical protein
LRGLIVLTALISWVLVQRTQYPGGFTSIAFLSRHADHATCEQAKAQHVAPAGAELRCIADITTMPGVDI